MKHEIIQVNDAEDTKPAAEIEMCVVIEEQSEKKESGNYGKKPEHAEEIKPDERMKPAAELKMCVGIEEQGEKKESRNDGEIPTHPESSESFQSDNNKVHLFRGSPKKKVSI